MLAEYQAGQDILQTLVARDPDNTGWQRDLAVSHNNVGSVYQAQGQLVARSPEYQASQRILQTLVARARQHRLAARSGGVALLRLRCVPGAGRLAEALAEYQAGQDILQTLVARDPDNTDWQRDLAVSHNKVGSKYEAQGRLAEALAEYQAGQDIMQTLVARDPDNTGWQRDSAVSYNNVGDVCQGQGQLAAALAEYQAYQGIMQTLVARDPDNTDWQRDLAVSHNKQLAACTRRRGNWRRRSPSIRRARASCRRWSRATPTTPAGSAICRCRTTASAACTRRRGNWWRRSPSTRPTWPLRSVWPPAIRATRSGRTILNALGKTGMPCAVKYPAFSLEKLFTCTKFAKMQFFRRRPPQVPLSGQKRLCSGKHSIAAPAS